MDPLLHASIGEYCVIESIGAGGMGTVYKAVHTHLGRVIAIKVLPAELADGAALQRFYGEASIQASLKHPGVAEYLGFYEYEGRPCILMEYVDGETLAEVLRQRGAFPAAEAVRIVHDIAAVAAHFHAQGVVHRDLKSTNVKLDSAGRVKVLDFGIARRQAAGRLTVAGGVVGTPHALAPEQVRGEEVHEPVDVWQLGVLFYELLTGRLPFESASTQELFARILAGDYTRAPEIPAPLAKIVGRCLEKDPARRYRNGAELCAALEGWQCPAKRRVPAWTYALAGLVLLAVLFVALRDESVNPPEAPPPGPAANAATAGNLKVVTVETADGSAQVFRDGRLVGTTPFQVAAKEGEKVGLVLRRPGFRDLPLQFELSERRQYTYTMEAVKDQR
jgi:eukaryotic-like serine/threonine-protein kinase